MKTGCSLGITKGLRDNDLKEVWDAIPVTKRKKLTKVIARIAERAYRRGAQQGVYFAREGHIKMSSSELMDYRYEFDLDFAPPLEADHPSCKRLSKGKRHSLYDSMHRLNIESGRQLKEVGIDLDEFDDF